MVDVGVQADVFLPAEFVVKLENEKEELAQANRKMMQLLGDQIVPSDDSDLSSCEDNFEPIVNTQHFLRDSSFAKDYYYLCNVSS